jgi:hypothetical protein
MPKADKPGQIWRVMLLLFPHSKGIVHQEFVPPGEMVNWCYYWGGGTSAKNAQKDGGRTGSFTMTMRLSTLLCQCSKFLVAESTNVVPHPSSRLIWHLVILFLKN